MSPAPLGRRALLRGGARGALALAAATCPVAACAQVADPGVEAAAGVIRRLHEPLPALDDPAFGDLFDRFGDARVVLLGEATHGTSEFYAARAAITRRLVERHGFTIVAVEADWADAAHVDAYVRGRPAPTAPARPFRRFPTWMWRNEEVRAFADWLRAHNAAVPDPARRAGFHGLDLYAMAASADVAAGWLETVNPDAAAEVRRNYACLAPYREEPERLAMDVAGRGARGCEGEAAAALELLRIEQARRPGDEAAFEALQHARVVAGAERYYRTLYEGPVSSWNLRDRHMMDTLLALLAARGPDARAVVWAHNSHVGDAAATDMGRRGEFNIGHLCRREFGEAARLIGFGTDRGTVMAASEWGALPEVKSVNPSLPGSWGDVARAAGPDRYLLDLRPGAREELRAALAPDRPERAIGVLYLPRTERVSHYYAASLSREYDGFLWFGTTHAVTPVTDAGPPLPEGHPLG